MKMFVHCIRFCHVKKSKTLFNIHLRMTNKTRYFQTIRFYVDYEYACVGEFFKAPSFLKFCWILYNHRSVGYISVLCIQFHGQSLMTSSSFRFCCRNYLILHQKKKWKWWKHKFVDTKQQKDATKVFVNIV